MKAIGMLIVAAVFEIAGDAAIRNGLIKSMWLWVVLGCALLAAYGYVVNTNRDIEFGRLLGLYIAVFFVVSQVVGVLSFGERPSPALLGGGALIVAGGLVILLFD